MSLIPYWEVSLPLFLITLLLVSYLLYNRKAKTEPSPIEEKSPYFQSRFGPLHYEVLGTKGPFVLLIHGIGSSTFCWRKLTPYLLKDYQLVLLDLWGFGKSTKEHLDKMDLDTQVQSLIELMDYLKIKNFHIIGHSLGGHIALWLTRKFPDRVDKLIAIAPPSHPSTLVNILSKSSWVSRLTPFFINPYFVKNILHNTMTDRTLVTEELISTYYEPFRDPKVHQSFAKALTLVRDPRVFNELSEIKNPTLLLYGAKDKVIKKRVIDEIHNKLPHSSVKTSAIANHMPMEDDVSWLSQEILAFLKSGTDQ